MSHEEESKQRLKRSVEVGDDMADFAKTKTRWTENVISNVAWVDSNGGTLVVMNAGVEGVGVDVGVAVAGMLLEGGVGIVVGLLGASGVMVVDCCCLLLDENLLLDLRSYLLMIVSDRSHTLLKISILDHQPEDN